MSSICSAPSDSNPDWCQRSLLILFAPHPFCAAFTASIPSYSTVTPDVTLSHPPHPSNYFSGISETMSAGITKRAAITSVGENKGICFVLPSPPHFLPHVFSLLYTQASDYNIFEGLECRGGPALVLSQGRVVYEEGALQVQQGSGRFIPRKQFPDYAYQRVKCRNQVSCTRLSAAWAFFYYLQRSSKNSNILIFAKHQISGAKAQSHG